MSKTKQAIHRHEQVTGIKHGYGGPPKGWTPERKEEVKRIDVYQEGTNIMVEVKGKEFALTKEEAMTLSFRLEAHVQDMEEQELGVCPRCKNAFEEMDGTPCMLCSSGDWAGVRDEKMTPAEIARDKAFAKRYKKEDK